MQSSAQTTEETMTTENAKKMFDAFYIGKRLFEQQPELPTGVTSSFIHVLDTVVNLQRSGQDVRISDISETLRLTRPGITRTVKQMEAQGYLTKMPDPTDGRVTHLEVTARGMELYEHYVDAYFAGVTERLRGISDEEIASMYETIVRISECYAGSH